MTEYFFKGRHGNIKFGNRWIGVMLKLRLGFGNNLGFYIKLKLQLGFELSRGIPRNFSVLVMSSKKLGFTKIVNDGN